MVTDRMRSEEDKGRRTWRRIRLSQ